MGKEIKEKVNELEEKEKRIRELEDGIESILRSHFNIGHYGNLSNIKWELKQLVRKKYCWWG